LFLAVPLLLLLLTIREGDDVGLPEGSVPLLLPLLLPLPGLLLLDGVAGALLEAPLEVLRFPARCWSLSESASSEATDTVLFDFCLMLHRVCTRDDDDLQGTGQQVQGSNRKKAVR
jgi:hypothetical protein